MHFPRLSSQSKVSVSKSNGKFDFRIILYPEVVTILKNGHYNEVNNLLTELVLGAEMSTLEINFKPSTYFYMIFRVT